MTRTMFRPRTLADLKELPPLPKCVRCGEAVSTLYMSNAHSYDESGADPLCQMCVTHLPVPKWGWDGPECKQGKTFGTTGWRLAEDGDCENCHRARRAREYLDRLVERDRKLREGGPA